MLLWSKSAANSDFVSMEWEGELANNLKIIPCLLDNTKLPIILSGRIYKSLTNFNERYNSLAKDLNLIIKEKKSKEVKKVIKALIIEESNNSKVTEKPSEAEKEIQERKAKIKPETEVIFKEKIVPEKIIKTEPTIKKQWLKPIGIIIICILLLIVSYVAIQQSDKKKIDKSIGLSENDVITILKKKNCFDKIYNPNGNRIENDYEEQEINGDRVIFDKATNLTWQQSGSPHMDYENAKKYIDKLNNNRFAGFDNWRLPKIEEVMSLVEPKEKNGLYINPIFDGNQYWIWTVSKVKDESRTWVVNLLEGSCYWPLLRNNLNVRAVRSRQ